MRQQAHQCDDTQFPPSPRTNQIPDRSPANKPALTACEELGTPCSPFVSTAIIGIVCIMALQLGVWPCPAGAWSSPSLLTPRGTAGPWFRPSVRAPALASTRLAHASRVIPRASNGDGSQDVRRPSFLSSIVRPLRDFGLGKRSLIQGSVGLFVISGIGVRCDAQRLRFADLDIGLRVDGAVGGLLPDEPARPCVLHMAISIKGMPLDNLVFPLQDLLLCWLSGPMEACLAGGARAIRWDL